MKINHDITSVVTKAAGKSGTFQREDRSSHNTFRLTLESKQETPNHNQVQVSVHKTLQPTWILVLL